MASEVKMRPSDGWGKAICTCDVCGRELSRSSMVDHFKAIHARQKRHPKVQKKLPGVCDVCGQKVSAYDRVAQHHFSAHPSGRSEVQAAAKARKLCDDCGKRFSRYHWRYVHGNMKKSNPILMSKPFLICDECGGCLLIKNIHSHWRSLHSDRSRGPGGICDVCDRKMYSRKAVAKHWLYKHAETGSAFALRQEALVRLDRKPSATCDICSLKLNSKTSLRVHWMALHGGQDETNFVKDRKKLWKVKKRSRLFTCDDCHVPFRGETRMGEHALRRHRNSDYLHEKRVERVCDSCGFLTNARSQSFAAHITTHVHTKIERRARVACDTCSLTVFRSNFPNHMRLAHSYNVYQKPKTRFEDEEEGVCDNCSRKCRKCVLQSHLKKCDV